MATLALHHTEIGWVGRYIFSTDHKVIAKQYLLIGLFSPSLAALLRWYSGSTWLRQTRMS